MITPQQRKRLFALASNAGVTESDLYEAILLRYSLEHTTHLTQRQYEQLCCDLQHWDKARDEPDITPMVDNTIGSYGNALLAMRDLAGAGKFFLHATDDDLQLAADLIESFRKCRVSWRRVKVHQVETWLSTWRAFRVEWWREAADRYLRTASDKGERYFVGILRNVAKQAAKDPGVAQTAKLDI